ncbi:type I toxin-antitoxin system Fst family toxin [Lapidilactobacillus wuchangensis]
MEVMKLFAAFWAPLLVGLILALFNYWLNNRNKK